MTPSKKPNGLARNTSTTRRLWDREKIARSVYLGHGNPLGNGRPRPSQVIIGNRPRPKSLKLGKKPKSRKVETARTSPSAFFTNSGPGYDDLTPEEQKIYDEQLDAFYECDLDD